MSNLAHQGDDHPEAAAKHLDDATALLQAAHHDGAGYLAGYVIECALKTVIIVDEIARSGGLGPTNLAAGIAGGGPAVTAALTVGMTQARRLKHDLGRLSQSAVALASQATAATAAYAPSKGAQSIYDHGWTESLRYAARGAVLPSIASLWVAEGKNVYEATIAKMRRDGVIF